VVLVPNPSYPIHAFGFLMAGGVIRSVPAEPTPAFFPAAERMVLVFHGLAETAEDDASDIHDLLGAVERIDPAEVRAGAHYLSVLEKRTRGRDAALEALNDGDLQPEGLDTADPSLEALQAVMKSEGLQEAAQYRRAQVEVQLARDLLQSKGRDPDALGVRLAPREKPPTAAEMPAYLKKLREQMDAQRWAALDDAATHAETAIAFVRKHKPAPEKLQHRGPPLFSAKQQLAELEGAHRTAGKPFDRARIGTALWRLQNSLHVDYLQTALEPDELLVEVRVPKLGQGWGYRYEKFHRVAQAWAIVGVAALVQRSNGSIGEARIGLTNMGATPLRASAAEQALSGADVGAIGTAAEQAAEGTSPPSDLNGAADYRQHLARVLTKRAVTAAAGA